MKRLAALLLVAALIGCTGPSHMTSRTVDGETLHYDLRVYKRVDKKDKKCMQIRVHVRPLPKLYSGGRKPPRRLKLYDKDCERPFRFEAASYVSERGGVERVFGREMSRFRADNERIFHEVHSFLFKHDLLP